MSNPQTARLSYGDLIRLKRCLEVEGEYAPVVLGWPRTTLERAADGLDLRASTVVSLRTALDEWEHPRGGAA